MNYKLSRFIKHAAVLLLGSAVAGMLLLVLVFCLPRGRMTAHVAESVNEMIREQEQIPEDGIGNYIWTKREIYTDAIMVQNAVEEVWGKNAYEHAIWMYHYDVSEEVWEPENSIRAFCVGRDVSKMYLHTYARYWHGYLIYLKPLLFLMNWEQVVYFGIILQIVLMAAVVFAAIRAGSRETVAVVACGVLFIKPLLVLVSLTMSVCWIITLAALLVMLLCHNQLERRKWYPEFFLVTGIATAYFDFLTYPVVTLGFPLCVCFLIKEGESCKEKLLQLAGYCISWGIGYGGMWALKWVIADVTLHTGTIKDALWSIIGRTEAIGGRPRFNGGGYVIGLNLDEYDSVLYRIAAIILVLTALAVVAAACRKAGTAYVMAQLAPFVLVFCIPFVWIILVQHHSALHARFTFRILSVAMLAICCMGAKGIRIYMAAKDSTAGTKT